MRLCLCGPQFGAAAATGQPSSLVLVGTDCCERHPLPWHIWEGVLQRDTPKARFLQAITEHCVPDTKAKSPQGMCDESLMTERGTDDTPGGLYHWPCSARVLSFCAGCMPLLL